MPNNKASKWVRWIYLPDVHGDKVNRAAWEVVKNFKADFEPDRIIMGGDVMDLRAIRKGASQEERMESMEPDFNVAMELLREIEPTDWTLGNHDDRLWELARSKDGALGDLGRYMVGKIETWAKVNGVSIYDYHIKELCHLGPRLSATHGFATNLHTAKKMADTYPGGTICGHRHNVDYYRSPTYDHREAWLCGCLCEVYQDYNKKRFATFSHVNGFAYGEYRETDGMYDVQIAQERFGEWRIAGGNY